MLDRAWRVGRGQERRSAVEKVAGQLDKGYLARNRFSGVCNRNLQHFANLAEAKASVNLDGAVSGWSFAGLYLQADA